MADVVYEPEWLARLEDQFINVGESIEYVFGGWDSLNSIAHIHTEVIIQRNSLIR